MNAAARELKPRYTQALQEYLAGAGETALRSGYDLGRQAVADGLGVLDLIAVHDEAARTVLADEKLNGHTAASVQAMHSFLIESLSPFELAHRSFRETNAALHRLNEVLEQEIKRIAHMLHDDGTQLLAAVHIALADLAHELPPDMRERVRDVRGLLDQIEQQLRHLSHELRPTILDDLGLMPAIEFLAAGIGKRTGLAVAVEGTTGGRLRPAVETALYRIVQEGLVNAARHAQARHAVVQLVRQAGRIRCAIRDNGSGFDVNEVQARRGERGLGLTAIRERLGALGGTLTISASPDTGTELLAVIPLED